MYKVGAYGIPGFSLSDAWRAHRVGALANERNADGGGRTDPLNFQLDPICIANGEI